MVTKSDTHTLLHTIDLLSYLNNECRNLPDLNKTARLDAKSIGGVADTLENILEYLDDVTETIEKLDKVKLSIQRWINKLDKNYSDEEKAELPSSLKIEDAKLLEEDTQKWMDTIIESFRGSGTSIIKENSIKEIIPENIMIHLDEIARNDLKDGINVLLHLYPTPATMILFRVAEHVVQELFKKTTGKDVEKRPWGKMLEELEHTGKVKKSLMGYLWHLNEKRIISAHPYKRFTQDEAERILLQIRGLIEEINSLSDAGSKNA